ncbi:N-acetyltransferase, partial [Vibrio vulnificus]|nr:N-acetyltransferase [Vibrio vulnificus]
MSYKEREATVDDYEFLFELKKLAEFDAIKSVFGWDESLQWKLHLAEWNEAKPAIIEISGKRAGSYLLQNKGDSLYFGRF